MYTNYHPRWHRKPMSTYWWLERRSYFAFIMREVSSVFIAWLVVFLMLLVRAVGRGDASYQQFLEWSGRPLLVVLNIVSLSFVVFHAITWFNLAPKAMVVYVRQRRVPARLIALSNYLAWAVASALVAWLILGG